MNEELIIRAKEFFEFFGPVFILAGLVGVYELVQKKNRKLKFFYLTLILVPATIIIGILLTWWAYS